MYQKIHKGQTVIWIILIIAIVGLIVLWVSKNPSSIISTTQNNPTEYSQPSGSNESEVIDSSKTLQEINQSLNDLNTSASDIDKGINDTQIDINQ